MAEALSIPLEPIDAWSWRIPRSYKPGMRVDGIVYADRALLELAGEEQALEQVANVAFLPGIQKASLAMPDIHWGYGFCIGGVCATDPEQGGVVSPGGVGYDINCGVRLVRTDLTLADARPHLTRLVNALFAAIPTGVGMGGRFVHQGEALARLLREGVDVLRRRGLATADDVECTESHGCLPDAEPAYLSERALERGYDQCGTIGSGNHFLEVQVVDRVEDPAKAEVMRIAEGQICVLIHSGSRGLGYQVCDDHLKVLRGVPERLGIQLPDRQLACAPVHSDEGRRYLGAMRAAANFAFCNRQLLLAQTREVFAEVFGKPWGALGMEQVYDVAHNIAKFEHHDVDGRSKLLCVHRKGATRAFPPGHPEIPARYRGIGQPVIVPGDMGRASWLLCGHEDAMARTFGTTCHGAGRVLSRTAAVKSARGRRIDQELFARGVLARARSREGLAEEQPDAYKDVDHVVEVVHGAHLSRKVARLRPLAVIKG
ncbi:MAG: RtcB family protein [Planctomycetes bacterium]|nr:RtcB family protein [Planctomycetota bacterium]